MAPPAPDLRPAELPDLSPADSGIRGPAKNIDFEGVPQYTTGSTYTGMGFAVGDFDRDGVPDAVMPLQNDDQIALLFGDGKGGYKPVVTVSVQGAFDLAVADLNQDGKLDILVTQNSLAVNQFAVLLGNGDGTFQSALLSGDPGIWTWPILVDVDGDGKLDAVTSVDASVYIVNGNGDGTFATTSKSYSFTPYSNLFGVADVNGDGKPDIVLADTLATSGPQIQVQLNLGSGAFATGTRYDALTGNRLNGLAVTDCNGDGYADLIFTDAQGVSVRLGSASGALTTGGRFGNGAYAANPLVADWNGDGKPDLIVGDGDHGIFKVLVGTGGCNFATPVVFAGGYSAGAMQAADLNGDKKLDLILSEGDLGVALGNGDGTFRAPRVQYTGANPSGVGLGDFNGDGQLDLVASQPADQSISVSAGHGDGTFGAPTRFPLPAQPGQVLVADVSGDGVPDVLIGLPMVSQFAVLFGNGKGGFSPPQAYAGGDNLAVADINGDGHLDIVTADYANLSVVLGSGNGSLSPGPPVVAGGNIWSLSLGDLDGDGHPDAAVVDYQGASLALAHSQGDHFAAVQKYPALGMTMMVRLADFDGDGKQDALVVQADGLGLDYYAGNGDGTVKPAQSLPFDAHTLYTAALAFEDFNEDGLKDLFLISGGNAFVQVNRGLLPVLSGMPPSFDKRKLYQMAFPQALAAGDVTGDGLPDVVISSNFGGQDGYVTMLRNVSR